MNSNKKGGIHGQPWYEIKRKGGFWDEEMICLLLCVCPDSLSCILECWPIVNVYFSSIWIFFCLWMYVFWYSNCGKIHIKFTTLTLVKCTVQWQKVHVQCNHHHPPIAGTLYPINTNYPLSLPLGSWWLPFYFVSADLTPLGIPEVMHYVSFCDWLISATPSKVHSCCSLCQNFLPFRRVTLFHWMFTTALK